MMDLMAASRCFLFLQGPPSPLWPLLGKRLEENSHVVKRVNLCLADAVFWRGWSHDNYRGRFENWEAWLRAYIDRHGVTDILYYADRLPYHVVAQKVASERGLRTHAIEYGYLRPDWLTHEPVGLGPNSTFPRDPEIIRAIASAAPVADRTVEYPHRFEQEATREVLFNLLMVFGRPFYPFYRSDRYYWPVIEYLSSAKELIRKGFASKRYERAVDHVLDGSRPFNLLALQVQSDYQIRSASPYDHLEEMVEEAIVSFKFHAPPERVLVIKTHPLDCGLEFWERRIDRLTTRHGMQDRVELVQSWRLMPLIQKSEGVVMTNSTVGLYALAEGAPVKAMGSAIYDLLGLTHQGPLDSFWRTPEAPDPDLAEDFFRAIAATIQVKGSFFNAEGLKVAVDGIVHRLETGFGPLDAFLSVADKPDS